MACVAAGTITTPCRACGSSRGDPARASRGWPTRRLSRRRSARLGRRHAGHHRRGARQAVLRAAQVQQRLGGDEQGARRAAHSPMAAWRRPASRPIERARANGSWELLDSVERLEVPPTSPRRSTRGPPAATKFRRLSTVGSQAAPDLACHGAPAGNAGAIAFDASPRPPRGTSERRLVGSVEESRHQGGRMNFNNHPHRLRGPCPPRRLLHEAVRQTHVRTWRLHRLAARQQRGHGRTPQRGHGRQSATGPADLEHPERRRAG